MRINTRHILLQGGLTLFIVGAMLTSAANAQLPVEAGLQLWLDASDSSTLYTDAGLTIPTMPGDPVAGWADKSGNGYNATQTNPLKVPVRNDTGMNGFPTVSFSGVVEAGMQEGDGMLIGGLSLARPYTAFIVNQYTGDIRGRSLQGQDDNWLMGLWAGRQGHFANGWVSGQIARDVNIPMVADATGDDTQSSFFVNGLDFTTDTNPRGAPGGLALAAEGAFPAEASDADISEVIVYNRVLDAGEMTQVRDYLYDKYDVTLFLPPEPTNTVLGGSVGAIGGGDTGEGGDFSGNFEYAINVGGPGGAVVGDATFTDGSIAGMQGGSSPGATINEANEIGAWHTAEYGDTPDDDGLEQVMTSIRWNTPPGQSIDLVVTPGQEYHLQLLFAESCCDRGFDISVEGELMVDNFNVPTTQGGINNAQQGAIFSLDFVAGDDTLNISLGGSNPLAPDNNPILNGLTLEAVPEPGSIVLALLGIVGLGLAQVRRRRRR